MKLLYLHQWSNMPLFLDKIKHLSNVRDREVIAAILVNKKDGFENNSFLSILNSKLPEYVKEVQFISYDEFLEKQKWNENNFTEAKKIYCHFSVINSPLEHKVFHQILQAIRQDFWLYSEEKKGYVLFLGKVMPSEEKILADHACELIKSGNFSACKKLVASQQNNKELLRVLTFGEQLLKLHFETNRTEEDIFDFLAKWLIKMKADKEAEYVQMFKNIRLQEPKAFISFLHNYAKWLYEQEDLIDFIVLYYRLAEETLLYALGWDTKPRSSGVVLRKDALFFLSLPKEKVSNHYHRYLQQLKREIRKIEERKGVTIRRNKCRGLETLNQRERYFTDLYLFFQQKSFEDFLDLRHEGVSGHGFADFTKVLFENMLDGKKPLEVIEPMLETLNLNPPYSIFEIVQRIALSMIQSNENSQVLQ